MNARRRPGHLGWRWITATFSDADTCALLCSIVLLLAALIELPADAVILQGNFSSPPAFVGLHLK